MTWVEFAQWLPDWARVGFVISVAIAMCYLGGRHGSTATDRRRSDHL